MSVIVKKWGNSAAVRIPSKIMAAADLVINQSVELEVINNNIIIKPTNDGTELGTLLAAITSDNMHGEVLTGPAKGKEIW